MAGALSSWIAGALKDSCGIARRGSVLTTASFGYTTMLLVLVSRLGKVDGMQYHQALVCMVMLSFWLYLIYNYLTSFALDFGGSNATATANGILLSSGFLGAYSFTTIHKLITPDWTRTVAVHAVSSVFLLLISITLWYHDRSTIAQDVDHNCSYELMFPPNEVESPSDESAACAAYVNWDGCGTDCNDSEDYDSDGFRRDDYNLDELLEQESGSWSS